MDGTDLRFISPQPDTI